MIVFSVFSRGCPVKLLAGDLRTTQVGTVEPGNQKEAKHLESPNPDAMWRLGRPRVIRGRPGASRERRLRRGGTTRISFDRI